MSRARAAVTAPAPSTARGAGAWLAPLARLDPLVPGTVLLAISRIAMAWIVPVPAEDAFITFRFARSLATGQGAVFNPGERVMGFTSPVWMAWIATGIPLFHDPTLWSRVTAAALSWVTLACTCRLLERHVSRTAAWAFVIAFTVWPYFASLPASGMEMDLVLAGLALSMWLIDRGSRLAGAALGVLALTRPECLAAVLVLGVVARPRDRRIALALVIVRCSVSRRGTAHRCRQHARQGRGVRHAGAVEREGVVGMAVPRRSRSRARGLGAGAAVGDPDRAATGVPRRTPGLRAPAHPRAAARGAGDLGGLRGARRDVLLLVAETIRNPARPELLLYQRAH